MNMHDHLLRATVFQDRRAHLERDAAVWAQLAPSERRRALKRRRRLGAIDTMG